MHLLAARLRILAKAGALGLGVSALALAIGFVLIVALVTVVSLAFGAAWTDAGWVGLMAVVALSIGVLWTAVRALTRPVIEGARDELQQVAARAEVLRDAAARREVSAGTLGVVAEAVDAAGSLSVGVEAESESTSDGVVESGAGATHRVEPEMNVVERANARPRRSS